MESRTQLPHLIRLLEDESDVVRKQIMHQLVSFGPTLEEELHRQQIVLSPSQKEIIADLLDQSSREWLAERWGSWFEIREDKLKLEMALGLLAQYLHGVHRPVALGQELDLLAAEYRASHPTSDARSLAQFLFTAKGIASAGHEDFYNPLHSSLVHAINGRRGIPITLCVLYILVGHRLGLDIEGCNFPGHFLALAFSKHQKHIVDCANGGKFITEKDFATLRPSVNVEMNELFQLECDALIIIMRVLRNLINAYQHQNRQTGVEFMGRLLRAIEAEEPGEEEE